MLSIKDIKVIGLIGGGSTAAELCIFFAQHKFEVYLHDRNYKLLEKSKEHIEKVLKKIFLQRKKKREEINEIRNRIKITLNVFELGKAADILIDTRGFFNIQHAHIIQADRFCKPEIIFALNFSNKIVFIRLPELSTHRKIIGLHFFSPFLTLKRVDLIKTSVTSKEVLAYVYNFLKNLDLKIKYYETDYLKSTIYLKINKFLNQILWFKNQFIKRNSQGKISIKSNLRRMSKYYYQIYEKINTSLRSPFRAFRQKIFRFKIRLNQFIYKRKDNKNIMINLGGGANYRKHWRIMDMYSNWFQYESLFIYYNFDMGKNLPFPFEDNFVKFFYSSHCFEHINPKATQTIFNEIYRCLKPGGAARILLPDFDLAYEAYGKKDEKFFRNVLIKNRKRVYYARSLEVYFINFFASYCAHEEEILKDVEKNYKNMTKEEFANYYINLVPNDWHETMVGSHSNWFNYEKIEKMLKTAGFKKIYRSDYQKSKFPEMRGGKVSYKFDISGKGRTVYVEALK